MTLSSFHKRHPVYVFICFLTLALSACGGEDTETAAASAGSGATGNQAPTLSGTPAATVVVGGTYSFTPVAKDPNGDILAFSRTGTLPPGLSFNTATGVLSGTPTTAGTYAGIVIAVSDGKGGTATLPAFTITVSSGAPSNAVLTWTAPTLNTDGSPLTDLAGYKVYYGTDPTSLTNSMPVASGTTTVTISNLPAGQTYYFAIASISASGGEGNKSNLASKTI